MSNWDLRCIKELGTVITGKTPPTSEAIYYGEQYMFATPTDLSYDTFHLQEVARRLSKEARRKFQNQFLPVNAIMYTSIASIGKIGITSEVTLTNQQINSIVVNKNNNPYFLYYSLKMATPYFQAISGGVATPIVNKNTFENTKIFVPNLPTQERIADILSAYDDLIEANNRRIELLEQTAQELYKEWFVRFRFLGHENAKFKNGLPEGWERNKIQKYYNTCSGGTPSRSKPEHFENGIYPWVKTGEIKDCVIIDTEEYITQDAVNSSSAKVLPAKSVAMAMYGVNIGLLAYFDSEMTCNQACCVFSDKRDFSSKHYLYYCLKSIREYLLLISFGAAQQNLSQDLIKKIKITMPSDDVVKAFEKQIDDIYESIRMLLKKNKNLAEQRDMLLPRLMSGKLEV